MHDYRIDAQRTAVAYHTGFFLDKKQRSYYDNLGHIHARGVDRSNIRDRLFAHVKGLCADCGRYRDKRHGDLAHRDKTPKTRCECIEMVLPSGEICTGIDWLCTMDVRRGGGPQSCHAKRHNRDPQWTPRREKASQ